MACDLNNQKTQLFNSQILPASGDFEYHFQTQQAHKARSVLEICNSRDKDTVLALAWEDSDLPGQYMSKGWYVLAAGKCLSNMVVDSNEVLLHVEDDKRELLLPGTVEVCVDDLHAFQFSKATQMACNGTNQMRAKFATQAIDAGDTRLTVPN